MKIPVVKEILSANDQVAADNRSMFEELGVFVVNFMASPGAGKTSLLLAMAERLPKTLHPSVIEGDIASRIDADKIAAHGIPVVQINTGGSCHLDAPMIRTAMAQLPLKDMDLLFIENVGNLVCPADFALGANLSVVVASAPEGHDKPYKYPSMFAKADAVLLNKSDLLAVFDFDVEYFRRGVEMVNPGVPFFPVSCKTGEGLNDYMAWLLEMFNSFQDDRKQSARI